MHFAYQGSGDIIDYNLNKEAVVLHGPYTILIVLLIAIVGAIGATTLLLPLPSCWPPLRVLFHFRKFTQALVIRQLLPLRVP